MEPIRRPRATTVEVALEALRRCLFGRAELRMIDTRRRLVQHRREVVADRVRQHEVTVGESLHQRRRAESVGAVIREVDFASRIETGDRGHQLVVDPQPAHRVVTGGVHAHRGRVRIFAGDALVHLEQVAVALFHDVLAKARDRCREIEVSPVLQRPNPATTVNCALRCARGNVARCQVAEARVQTL